MWLALALSAQAHVPQTAVIESVERRALPTRSRVPWSVQPVGEHGLVAYTEERGVLVARRYDRELALQWSVALPEVVADAPVRTQYRSDAAWAVFQRRALAVVTRHDLQDGTARAWVVPLDHRSRRVVDFETSGNDAWLVVVDGGTDGDGTLRHLDLESGIAKKVALPPTSERIELQRLTPQPERGTVDVAYRTMVDGRFTQHVAVARAGDMVDDLVLQIPELNLLDVQRQYLPDGNQLVVGTYADEATGTRAQGFYTARVDRKGRLLYTATHSFATFRHFFDDLPVERRRTRQKLAAERQRRGQDLDIDVRFATHDVQFHEGRVVLSGEVYTPRVGTIPRVVVVDVDGGIQAPTLAVTDGYWFTHTVAAAFEPDGTLVWDASLPMRNVGSSRVEPRSRVGLHGDVATLAYAAGDTLVSRVFSAGREVEERAQRPLVTYDRAAVRSRPLQIEPWFDNQWVSFGPQRLRAGGRQFVIERMRSLPATDDRPPKAVLRPIE
ncbi:MAG: hypothetical protein AAF211_06090 [Myxococcota bacterium]